MSKSQCKISESGYLYSDHDILLINKARNYIEDRRYAFSQYYVSGDYHAISSGILLNGNNSAQHLRDQNIDSLQYDSFVRNDRNGIVVECPAMSLNRQEAGSASVYLSTAISDIIAFSQNDRFQVYPAKILFPYNPGGGHWIVGEVILNREVDGNFTAQMTEYNPLRAQSNEMNDDFKRKFRTVFQSVAVGRNLEILRYNAVAIGQPNPANTAIQIDGSSCGVFTAHAFDKLKTGNGTNMWSDFLESATSGAVAQRRADERLVRDVASIDQGIITPQSLETFGLRDRHAGLPMRSFGSSMTSNPRFSKELPTLNQLQQEYIQRFLAFSTHSQKEINDLEREVDVCERKYGIKLWKKIFSDKRLLTEVVNNNQGRGFLFILFNDKTSSAEKEEIVRNTFSDPSDSALISTLVNKLEQLRTNSRTNHNPHVSHEERKLMAVAQKAAEIQNKIEQFIKLLRSRGPAEDTQGDVAARNAEKIAALNLLIKKYSAEPQFFSLLLEGVLSDDDWEGLEGIKQFVVYTLLENGAATKKPEDFSALYGDDNYVLRHETLLQMLADSSADDIKKFFEHHKEPNDIKAKEYRSVQDGSSALHQAAKNRDPRVLEKMFRYLEDTDINNLDNYCQTPLMIAVRYGNAKNAEFLIRNGADLSLLNNEGYNVEQIAQEMQALFKGDSAKSGEYEDVLRIINEAVAAAAKKAAPVSHAAVHAPALTPTPLPAPATPTTPTTSAAPLISAPSPASAIPTPTPPPVPQSIVGSAGKLDLSQNARQMREHKPSRRFVPKNLSISPFDFLTDEEIRLQKTANPNKKIIEITGDDLSFSAIPDSEDRKGYVKLEGALKDIFKTENTKPDGTFQPYYANFNGLLFSETSGKKIFGNANLFMANFNRCEFQNVDFSAMSKEIFLTMQFDTCTFTGCNLPKGVVMEDIERPKEPEEKAAVSVARLSGTTRPISYECVMDGHRISRSR